ncbi:MAG: hypothetical protein M0Z47_10920 [Actinomycetota bacterium]|nr:hypothetical protein [Actinomycetota bacterium]
MRSAARRFAVTDVEYAVRLRDEAQEGWNGADPNDPLTEEAAYLRWAAAEVYLRAVLARHRRENEAS